MLRYWSISVVVGVVAGVVVASVVVVAAAWIMLATGQ